MGLAEGNPCEIVVRSVETFSFASLGGNEIAFAMATTPLFDVLYICRYNKASECAGAGVRLGGWEVDGTQYGHSNNVRPAPWMIAYSTHEIITYYVPGFVA